MLHQGPCGGIVSFIRLRGGSPPKNHVDSGQHKHHYVSRGGQAAMPCPAGFPPVV
jgi:hypothetical protein